VDPNLVTLDEEQLKRIKIEPVRVQAFRVEKRAIGRIAFNEDRTTPVFTPYTGRVVRLIAKPGDEVKPGSPLLEIDTADLVQVESDLINAGSALKKAKNQLELARRVATRQEELYQVKAIPLKDLEQAQSDLRNAESDVRAAEGAYGAARDRLRLFGKNDVEIAKLEEERAIHPRLQLVSPIAGTITARKVGPGQYVKPDNPDPLFTIADLSTMWLLANVGEADIPLVQVGQLVEVRVMAYPKEVFRARITYIGAAVDPATHRVAVRAEVANPRQKLKPEMFASFRILTNEEVQSPAVPISAIVGDGEKAMVWVEKAPRQFTRRDVKLGLEQNGLVQVLSGVQAGERVVAEGGVFLSNVEQVGYR
jgi:cobalt-zinc-cadmium efflux system membrane fusion protein